MTDTVNYINLSFSYRAKGMYEKAREVLESYQNNVSNNALLQRHLAYNSLCQGKYDLALVEADKAFTLDPDDWTIPWTKGDVYHSLGDLENAVREYEKIFDYKDQIAHVVAKFSLGSLYTLKGILEESKNQFRQGIEKAKEVGDEWWESRQHLRLAYVLLLSGDYEEALEECDKAWSLAARVENLSWQRVALHLRGLIYLEMKSIDETKNVANELKELIETGMNKNHMRYYFHLMGMIELERENFSEAVGYFEQAILLLPYQKFWAYYYPEDHPIFLYSLASAYDKVGDAERAIQEYEKIIFLTSARLWHGDLIAKSFYMLGKIYEQKGWKGKAIENYEKFLDLWNDADPGIVEVEDAKKRLDGLQNNYNL